ncbi:GGDEF domain-containing protein [Xylophilus sp. ASV27]|uniref:GGDEF domain-containing protein n=1 Tax=Xylophilus sp. ASV27 TaxID=2795129 RepID=UPI0018EA9938|nr:GGDEF domain-containing protein [Xylophilus sp. ASV27]
MHERSPSEIARETLKQLAVRKLTPTPENYQALYDEIGGTLSSGPFPDAALRRIAQALPGQTPVQKRLLTQFSAAVEQRSWSELQRALHGYAQLGLGAAAADAEPPEPAAPALPAEWLEQTARLVEYILPALPADDARLHESAAQVLQALRHPTPDTAALPAMLGNLAFRLSFAAEEQAAVQRTLLASLQLVFQNIGELSSDDRWLRGQAEALREAATPPLSLRRLDELQVRLKDVIFKQSEAKARQLDAQEQMKQMLASFIERLSQMSENSGIYHDMVEGCAQRLGAATSLEEIAPVLQEVIAATRAMALDSRVHRDELQALQERTTATQAEIARLQQELVQASAQARHDPLTGALNRKGLDEAMERELARARRASTPLCLGMLDIDNFKKINDHHGHDSGDAALLHLANVARAALRAQDSLARYGGEEFVVLMPDTAPTVAVEVLQRLQRELTKHFFLANNEKVLITFSAGVSALAGEEDLADALRRADQAMYLAKRAGKNRVMLG